MLGCGISLLGRENRAKRCVGILSSRRKEAEGIQPLSG